jgi:hypothetical protein
MRSAHDGSPARTTPQSIATTKAIFVLSANRRSAVPARVSPYKYPGVPAQRDLTGTRLRRSNKYTATLPKTAYATLTTRTTRNQLAMRLTMRLSDAGLRQRPTKLIYPDHRPHSLAYRRRGPRSFQPIVSCHPTKLRPCLPRPILAHLLQHRQAGASAHHFAQNWRLSHSHSKPSIETARLTVHLRCAADSGQPRRRPK